jgi:hypothetical protein
MVRSMVRRSAAVSPLGALAAVSTRRDPRPQIRIGYQPRHRHTGDRQQWLAAGMQVRHDISPVDKVAPRVDDCFFLTHPVDSITPGNEGVVGRSFGLVLSTIPSPRTGTAAFLHRLSTDLRTARLDAGRRSQKTIGSPRRAERRIVRASYYCRFNVSSWSCP